METVLFLLGKYLGVELPEDMLGVCLTELEIAKLACRMAVPISILISNKEEIQFYISPVFGMVFFISAILVGMK